MIMSVSFFPEGWTRTPESSSTQFKVRVTGSGLVTVDQSGRQGVEESVV